MHYVKSLFLCRKCSQLTSHILVRLDIHDNFVCYCDKIGIESLLLLYFLSSVYAGITALSWEHYSCSDMFVVYISKVCFLPQCCQNKYD